MSDLGYFIWLIAMAIAIVVVLTVGTLTAAGLVGTHEKPTDRRDATDARSAE